VSTRVQKPRHAFVAGVRWLTSSSQGAVVFVWSVWALMLLVVLTCIIVYSQNIPLAEDWLLVPPLTGHEPNMTTWLWAQNNEHRIPFPKLLLLLLLKLTGGDFRVGMFFNALGLGALALAMMLVARHIRGGRTIYADAFFPIALLHIGNWENLVWSWQLSFILPTMLTCILLLVIVEHKALLTPRVAIIAGIGLILLPLCGANGLIFVPALALWLSYNGRFRPRLAEASPARRWTGLFLRSSAVVALLLSGIYFIGYERPWWNPPSPSMEATLKTSAKFLALGFGPVAAESWVSSTITVVSVLLASTVVLVAGACRTQGAERRRALGLLLFLSSMVVLAFGMGWGRAGLVPQVGMPMRYVLLAVPALCTSYFIWELYGPPFWRIIAQLGLLAIMGISLPINTQAGLLWRNWYRQGMAAVERDLMAGTPRSVLAERHRAFLLHWDQDNLASGMQMLHQAGIGPFRRLQEDSGIHGVHSPVGPSAAIEHR
jgi:hypothetical protein